MYLGKWERKGSGRERKRENVNLQACRHIHLCLISLLTLDQPAVYILWQFPTTLYLRNVFMGIWSQCLPVIYCLLTEIQGVLCDNSWVGALGVLVCFEIERFYRSLCLILAKTPNVSFKGEVIPWVWKGGIMNKIAASSEYPSAHFWMWRYRYIKQGWNLAVMSWSSLLC